MKKTRSRAFLARPVPIMGTLLSLLCLTLMATSAIEALEWRQGLRPTRTDVLGAPDLSPHFARDSVDDPTGDTFGGMGAQIDITSLSADVVNANLVISVTFAGAISPSDSGQPNALVGFIDIDADQNGATGDITWTDFLTGQNTTGMGNEFYVDLFSYSSSDGSVDVVDDPMEQVVGRAPVGFTGNSVSVTIPLGLLGDDGGTDVAAVLGPVESPTDIAPNQGSVSSTPETGDLISLRNGRFQVQIDWTDFDGNSGPGNLVAQSNESAIVYFFNHENWEVLIKILDACTYNDHFWTFFAATSNVEFNVMVTDTQSNEVRQYSNPLGHPADAVLDVQAFATCP